jgi:SAM-dependent methyltransferase
MPAKIGLRVSCLIDASLRSADRSERLESESDVARRKKPFKQLKLRLGLARPYQSKRRGGADERWELIHRELSEEDRSILDIGSNLGGMSQLAAAHGRFALGVEPDARMVRAARRRTRAAANIAFIQTAIDPDTVLMLPRFDVVFCLSVHHYWVSRYGENTAWWIIAELLARARRKFFFEPASVNRKYGDSDLDFQDLDRESIVEYNVKNLGLVASPDQSIRVLGETQCRPKEPFRMMFLVERRGELPDR